MSDSSQIQSYSNFFFFFTGKQWMLCSSVENMYFGLLFDLTLLHCCPCLSLSPALWVKKRYFKFQEYAHMHREWAWRRSHQTVPLSLRVFTCRAAKTVVLLPCFIEPFFVFTLLQYCLLGDLWDYPWPEQDHILATCNQRCVCCRGGLYGHIFLLCLGAFALLWGESKI